MSTDAESTKVAAPPVAAAAASRYTAVAQGVHWAVAGMIVLQYVLAKMAEAAEDADARVTQLSLLANHKSVGMTVLALAIGRLLWRLGNRPPALPAGMPDWQKSVSSLTHILLYGFLFALPVSGWLMSSAASYSVSWFGVFTWPDLVAADRDLRRLLADIHDWLAKGLFALAVLHIAAALKHHVIDKDTVLQRMSSAGCTALFVGIIAAGVLLLGNVGGAAPGTAATPAEATATTERDATGAAVSVNETASALTPWSIDYEQSFIRFTAEQAGAAFTGEWRKWTADLRFNAAKPAEGQFDVSIDIAGVDTEDSDRDSTLQSGDWFDADSYPVARFLTTRIGAADGGFLADATLSVKGIAHPVSFTFTVTEDGSARILTGTARLDRLALGVGIGEWADTDAVGQYVNVDVRVEATAE
ncbi:MAG: cytochrome b/b6 domain-containing protein [Pseudomonadota bacterium]